MTNSIIWDMDGVLVDTGELHYRSWAQTLPDFDIPLSRESFQESFGMSNAGVLNHLLGHLPPKELVSAVSERKEALFRDLIRGQAALLPGVSTWLDRLQEKGYSQAIASSAPPANIDALIDELAIRPYFEAIVSAAGLPGKPDPAVFLEAADRLQMPPARCIVIEDAIAGVEGAKRAGMKCIAVTTTNPAASLQAADIVVDRLTDLEQDAFERLFAESDELQEL